MKSQLKYTILFAFLTGIVVVAINRFSNDSPVSKRHIFYRMDTVTEISIIVQSGFNADLLWKQVDEYLRVSERRFSVTHPDSEIKLLNERVNQSMPVSEEVAEMIGAGIKYGDKLNGMFDITILPLKEMWGFAENSPGHKKVPDSAEIAQALSKVDYRTVELDESMGIVTFTNKDTQLDLGGLAKGFIIRGVESILKEHGITDFLIVSGGDILVSGKKADATPWIIGIQHPRERARMLGRVELTSGAIVTSGDYERYRIVEGERLHHIFNARTGYSCDKNQSVTVWASDPLTADILSTGLFCFTAEEIMEFVEAKDGIESVVVSSGGQVYVSRGWEREVLLYP
ncbi:Thiamin biosynthesis lipoprotein ApbE [Chitinispirillum alkaliphilum]|nr:Thiamin biosynthesis lipoprotein ApbE [Chitinispirillum alkaliphilum]